ncbi:hypothetical protein Tco_0349564, partial [Tanacetum coccineum]
NENAASLYVVIGGTWVKALIAPAPARPDPNPPFNASPVLKAYKFHRFVTLDQIPPFLIIIVSLITFRSTMVAMKDPTIWIKVSFVYVQNLRKQDVGLLIVNSGGADAERIG